MKWAAPGILIAFLLGVACAPHPESPGSPAEGSRTAVSDFAPQDWQMLDPPAGEGAMAANLAVVRGGLLLSWLEPGSFPEGEGHRFRVAKLAGGRWSPPATVAQGTGFFANWADFPSVVEAGDGSLVAHWLRKTGDGYFDYAIELARSRDGGATWKPLGRLHDDDTPAEHGFVSFVREGANSVRAFWLDGRAMLAEGPMALRSAVIGETVGPSRVLDERVCECCQTGAAWTHAGPVVVYRDRSAEEIRDISIVRRTWEGWSEPRSIHGDGWQIPGCPVNGPVVAARGDRVAVAWFTGAESRPRVQIAFSKDSGATFEPPVVVDGDRPLGRVDLALDREGGAVITWLAVSEDEAEVWLRRVAPDGSAGPPVSVARTSQARASGFPRLALRDQRLVLAWIEGGDTRRLRLRSLGLELLPPGR